MIKKWQRHTDSHQVTILRSAKHLPSSYLILVLLSVTFLLIRLPWQAQSIDVYVAFSMTALQWDKMVLYSLLTSTDQPSTLGSSTGTRILVDRSGTSIQRWCSALSPRTAAAIEAAAPVEICWSQTNPRVLSLFVVWPFQPAAESRGRMNGWGEPAQRQLHWSIFEQLSSAPIRVAGVPPFHRWDKCQDMSGCLRPAYWGEPVLADRTSLDPL